MRYVVNRPCTLSGRKYFIGEEVQTDTETAYIALEKMGILSGIRDDIPAETLEECVAEVGEVQFSIPIKKDDQSFLLDITEPQLQEAVETMQMPVKDAVGHIKDNVEDITVLILINAVDSRAAVKKETESKAKEFEETEKSEGDA